MAQYIWRLIAFHPAVPSELLVRTKTSELSVAALDSWGCIADFVGFCSSLSHYFLHSPIVPLGSSNSTLGIAIFYLPSFLSSLNTSLKESSGWMAMIVPCTSSNTRLAKKKLVKSFLLHKFPEAYNIAKSNQFMSLIHVRLLQHLWVHCNTNL